MARRPRIMFVTDEWAKQALDDWAESENLTTSSLLDKLVQEVLVAKGYSPEAPKKLLTVVRPSQNPQN